MVGGQGQGSPDDSERNSHETQRFITGYSYPFLPWQIDYDSLLRLFDHLFPHLEGFTLCGSTGESVSLSFNERIELMSFAVRNAPPGKAVVAGLAHTNLEEVIALARHAVKIGVRAGLVPCPYYFPNSSSDGVGVFQGS